MKDDENCHNICSVRRCTVCHAKSNAGSRQQEVTSDSRMVECGGLWTPVQRVSVQARPHATPPPMAQSLPDPTYITYM